MKVHLVFTLASETYIFGYFYVCSNSENSLNSVKGENVWQRKVLNISVKNVGLLWVVDEACGCSECDLL